jgi:hypothetical protein
LKKLVFWARPEETGYASNKCRGMMEYWNNGLRRIISFFDTFGKSGIKIKTISEFYTQYSIIPPFHSTIKLHPLWGAIKAGPSGSGFFTIDTSSYLNL